MSDGNTVELNDPQQVVAHIVKETEFIYDSDDAGLRFAVTTFDKNYYESEPAISENAGMEDDMKIESKFYYSNDMIYITGTPIINFVEVYSTTGYRMMYIPVNKNEITISCEALSMGVYIVRVAYEDGSNSVNKFMR